MKTFFFSLNEKSFGLLYFFFITSWALKAQLYPTILGPLKVHDMILFCVVGIALAFYLKGIELYYNKHINNYTSLYLFVIFYEK